MAGTGYRGGERIDYSRAKPTLGEPMDQSIPQPGFSGEPPRTELQRRVDGGEEPRTILEELYREWQAPLFVRARRSLGDARDAKDVVQEVFLKMHTNFDKMIAREPVRAWILTVANHELVDWNRRKKKSGGGELLADFDALEHNMARRSQAERFEEQVERWVGSVEPLLAYLRTLVAKGSLGDNHLRALLHQIAGRGTQQELARELGLTQPRISQLKSEVAPQVCAALYFCEILGIVRAPHREAEIRMHLDLVDLAAGLSAEDRALLRRAGGAVRLDHLGRPELLPKDAEAAIQTSDAGRYITLYELHDAESRYAAAIPNPTPHCIESPCDVHTASAGDPEGERR
jgi:RNA polymerase sigma factor (sigma-70 family)